MLKRYFLKNVKGQSFVEVAILVPLFLLILFSIVQFSIIISAYLIAYDAANDAARMAAVGKTDSIIKNHIFEKASLMPFLTIEENDIQISPTRELRRMNAYIIVSVPAVVEIVVPLFNIIFGQSHGFVVSASMRYELTEQHQTDTASEVMIDVFHLETKKNPNANSDIKVVVGISDNYGNPIEGAVITIEVKKNDDSPFTISGTTGADGTFLKENIGVKGSGSYLAYITDIAADMLIWSGSSPEARLYLDF